VGPNLVANGDFESSFPGPWTVSANHADSRISTSVKRSSNASLYVVANSAGTTQGTSIWQTLVPGLTQGATYTLTFYYLPAKSESTLTVRLSGSGVKGTVAFTPSPNLHRPADPGERNAMGTTLPAFPPLWINELQPQNLTGITNKAGERVPWIELYNPTTN